MASIETCILRYPLEMMLTSAECLVIAVFSYKTLLSMAEMLVSVVAFFSSWLSRRDVIEYRTFWRVAMVDSDLDSPSRSVLIDARELVSELEDSVDEASFGSGQVLGFQAASSGWK